MGVRVRNRHEDACICMLICPLIHFITLFNNSLPSLIVKFASQISFPTLLSLPSVLFSTLFKNQEMVTSHHSILPTTSVLFHE